MGSVTVRLVHTYVIPSKFVLIQRAVTSVFVAAFIEGDVFGKLPGKRPEYIYLIMGYPNSISDIRTKKSLNKR